MLHNSAENYIFATNAMIIDKNEEDALIAIW
jgi:hypothetical protein